MTSTAEPTAEAESPSGEVPLLMFLSEAGFSTRMRRRVDLATRGMPGLRETRDLPELMRFLRTPEQPKLNQLAEDLNRVVAAGCQQYPASVRGAVRVILTGEAGDPACSVEIFATVREHPGDVIKLARALSADPALVLAGVRLNDLWRQPPVRRLRSAE